MSSKFWRTFTLGCASAPPSDAASQRKARSNSMVAMRDIREIALDSSLVMLAFLNDPSISYERLKFSVPLSQSFKNDTIPVPLLNLLKYISQEGVTVPDIFRRPGNPNDQKKLIKKLSEGKPVSFAEYNFYTLASVIKRFLLSIPGGVFGAELEKQLLAVLQLNSQLEQYDAIHNVISSLPKSTQNFLALLFGVWFRVVNHSEFHSMSSEAMAKSVTGSIFVNSTENPTLVNKAAKVMEIIIENYAISSLFGASNLQFFADVTCSGIVVTERFTYKYRYPSTGNMERESSLRCFAQALRKEVSHRGLLNEDGAGQCINELTSPPLLPSQARDGFHGCMSVPDVNRQNKLKASSLQPHHGLEKNYLSKSLTKFETVKIRQMARLRRRSDWFLASKSLESSRKTTNTSESDGVRSEICIDESKSEVESVFDGRSVDTGLSGERHYAENVPLYEGSTNDLDTVTEHFVKETTFLPRNNVIPC